MPRGRWIVLTAVLSLLGSALAAELIVRLFELGSHVHEPRRYQPASGVPFVVYADGRLEYRPNAVFAAVYDLEGDSRGYFGENGKIVYRINARGMRGPQVAIEKPPDSLRIVCLGDSITFGEGVRYEDTYPAQLQALLTEAMPHKNVQVLNAGIQAYGTTDAAAFYLTRCAPYKPDIVTLGFFLNDATDRKITITQHEAMAENMELSLPSRISRIWEILERGRTARRLQQEYFETTRKSFESESWDICNQTLAGLKKVSEEDGFRFVVVVFPILFRLEDYPFESIHKQIAAACAELGIDHLDMLDVYRGRSAESLWVHPTDHHPNEIAHRLAAEALAERLLRRAD